MTDIINNLNRVTERIAQIEEKLQRLNPAPAPAGAFASLVTPAGGRPKPLSNPELSPLITKAAATYGLAPELLAAVIQAESGGNAQAVSPAGAQGLMQLMPGTAAGLGVSNPFDPEQNVMGGAHYLRMQLDRFGGDVRLALAAYNAGPGAVQRYHGVPPYAETQHYVTRVLSLAGMDE
jgi:soluble lytic murein transglycosylase-like protein